MALVLVASPETPPTLRCAASGPTRKSGSSCTGARDRHGPERLGRNLPEHGGGPQDGCLFSVVRCPSPLPLPLIPLLVRPSVGHHRIHLPPALNPDPDQRADPHGPLLSGTAETEFMRRRRRGLRRHHTPYGVAPLHSTTFTPTTRPSRTGTTAAASRASLAASRLNARTPSTSAAVSRGSVTRPLKKALSHSNSPPRLSSRMEIGR